MRTIVLTISVLQENFPLIKHIGSFQAKANDLPTRPKQIQLKFGPHKEYNIIRTCVDFYLIIPSISKNISKLLRATQSKNKNNLHIDASLTRWFFYVKTDLQRLHKN